jgi:hypothetical protein
LQEGGRGGAIGFFFVQNYFRLTTRELEFLPFFSGKAQIFLPEYNLRLYDKNSGSGFFVPPPKSEYFFSNIENKNIFLEKKPIADYRGYNLYFIVCSNLAMSERLLSGRFTKEQSFSGADNFKNTKTSIQNGCCY